MIDDARKEFDDDTRGTLQRFAGMTEREQGLVIYFLCTLGRKYSTADEREFLMRYRAAPPEVKMRIRTMLAKTGEEAHE